MLTPQEIQDQKFEKAVFGGYDMGQIDKFLDAVLSDYSSLYKENAALKAKMRVLVDKIEEYRAVDEELRKTLYNAQIAAKDTVSRAQAEAERIVRDAQFTANRNVTDLQGKITAEEKRLEDAKRQNAAYAEKIRKAMELGIRQMEDILEMSKIEPKAAPAPAEPVQEPVSASSPTHAVEVNGIFSTPFTTMMITVAQGPRAKPPKSAGKSETCKSNQGGKNGRLKMGIILGSKYKM